MENTRSPRLSNTWSRNLRETLITAVDALTAGTQAFVSRLVNPNTVSGAFALLILLSFANGFWYRASKTVGFSGLDLLRGVVPFADLGTIVLAETARLMLVLIPLAAIAALGMLFASMTMPTIKRILPVALSLCGIVSMIGCIAYLLNTTPEPTLNRVLDLGFWFSVAGSFGLIIQSFFNRPVNPALSTRALLLIAVTSLNAVLYLLTLYAEIARSRQNESVAFEITALLGLSLYGAIVGTYITGKVFQGKGHSPRLGRIVGFVVGWFGHLLLLIPLWIYTPYIATKQEKRVKIDEISWGMAFIAPWLIGFILLTVYPMLDSYRVAMYNWQGVGEPTQFVGLRHIENVIEDPIFWQSLGNTIVYTIVLVPIQLSLALVLAIILTRKRMKFVVLYRAIYFLPVVTSVAVIAVVMRLILGNFGTNLSELLGIDPPINPIASPQFALPSVIVFGIWHSFGVNLVHFLAALQTVPEELYDAAKVDGASWFEQLVHVTLPSIRPISIMIVFMATIGSMYVFEQSFVLTRGGPYFASQVVSGYIYGYAFRQPGTQLTPNFGYASAAALFFSMIMLVITGANYIVTNRMGKNKA